MGRRWAVLWDTYTHSPREGYFREFYGSSRAALERIQAAQEAGAVTFEYEGAAPVQAYLVKIGYKTPAGDYCPVFITRDGKTWQPYRLEGWPRKYWREDLDQVAPLPWTYSSDL